MVSGLGKDWLDNLKRRRVVGWSWRLAPTEGRSFFTWTPAAWSTDAGPMPLVWRSWGVWMAPAARMTSFFAYTLRTVPSERETMRIPLALRGLPGWNRISVAV